MDRPSNLVKTSTKQPGDLLGRLYREIGVSAVAAALAPASPAVPHAGSAPVYKMVGKAAA